MLSQGIATFLPKRRYRVTTWLTTIPVWLTIPLIAVLWAAFGALAFLIFRLFVPPERFQAHHDVLSAVVSVVGVLYSVVLAFLVGTVWTSFDAAQQTADQEARYVVVAFDFAQGLPLRERVKIRRTLARYALAVRDVEWPMLRLGKPDPQARDLLQDAVQTMLLTPPQSTNNPAKALKEETISGAVTQNLRDAGNDRVLRLTQARSRLPPVVFEALILGALLLVIFTFLFGMRPIALQVTTTMLLCASIGIFFGLIVDLNAPYAGPIRVSRDTWTNLIQTEDLQRFAR